MWRFDVFQDDWLIFCLLDLGMVLVISIHLTLRLQTLQTEKFLDSWILGNHTSVSYLSAQETWTHVPRGPHRYAAIAAMTGGGTEICSGATVPQLVDLKGIQLNAMMAKAGEKQAHHQPKGGMMKGHGCKWEMLGFSLFYKLNLEVASAVGHHQRWDGDDLDVSSCWQHWDPLAPFFLPRSIVLTTRSVKYWKHKMEWISNHFKVMLETVSFDISEIYSEIRRSWNHWGQWNLVGTTVAPRVPWRVTIGITTSAEVNRIQGT